jgi:LCT (Lysosomal Cystine Transporter) family transporter
VSNVIGYTYFFAWSLSFYPQIFLNWRRKTTVGLSPDYQTYNILGFVCYAIFNVGMYFVDSVKSEYEDRYDSSSKVQMNDVLFAVHAVAATTITLSQIVYYDGKRQMPSVACRYAMVGFIALILLYLFLVLGNVNDYKEPFKWLDWLYFLSYVKMAITLIKYVPQAVLNYTRKSTVGWNIWNVLLDFTGGFLSLLQLLLDCNDTNDWQGIAGDPVKFGLGFVSIAFDITFMIQHYVLYPAKRYHPLEEPLA